MRLLRFSLICLALLAAMSGISTAQINQYLVCGTEVESTVDAVIMESTSAAPGSVAWMLFSITNWDNPATSYPEAVAGFSILLKYDSAFVTPLADTADPTFIQVEVVGRLKTALDTVSGFHFFAQHSQNLADSGAILIGFNLGVAQEITMLEAGSGPVFKIPFIVDSLMPIDSIANFRFYAINECAIIDGGLFCTDCRRTNFATNVLDSIFTDTTGATDTAFSITTTFPELFPATITADSTPPPQIVEFRADPDTIPVGSQTQISWIVSNADNVRATGPNLDITRTDSVYSTFVQPPSAEGTYIYTLMARNQYDSVSATTNVVVKEGIINPNNPPVITVGSAFSTEVGRPLSFAVSATDADPDDIISLSAQGPLPTNAVFNDVVGSGGISGTFSWTPDFGQEGSYTIVFEATDGIDNTQSAVVISVTAILQDRLFTTSAANLNPVGGLSGKRGVLFPIDLVTAQSVYGLQFDFVYDALLFKVDSFSVTNRTPEYIVYDNIGQTPGTIKILTFGLANEPVQTDITTAVLRAAMSIDSSAVPGDYPVFIRNAWEAISPDPAFPSLELAIDSGIIQVDLPGDINLDKKIDVADVVNIVAYIIGTFPFPERQFEVADVITNNVVNVFDLVGIINLVFGIPLSPISGQPIFNEWATVELDYTDLSAGQSDELIVRSNLPTDIAGVEIVIEYDPAVVKLGKPALTEDNGRFALKYDNDQTGRFVAIMNFTNPFRLDQLINSGNADLLTIPLEARNELEAGNEQQLRITRAWLSTSESVEVPVEGLHVPLPTTFALKQNYPNPFNPITTIEFSLGVNEDGSAAKHVNLDIFNILGRHVKSLVDNDMIPGHYQVIWDATSDAGQKTATGIYLYRLRVGDEMKTKKMLLLK